jgi:hypothetical protein
MRLSLIQIRRCIFGVMAVTVADTFGVYGVYSRGGSRSGMVIFTAPQLVHHANVGGLCPASCRVSLRILRVKTTQHLSL